MGWKITPKKEGKLLERPRPVSTGWNTIQDIPLITPTQVLHFLEPTVVLLWLSSSKQQLPQEAGPHGVEAPDYLHTCWFLCWLCCITDFCIPAITWVWVGDDTATPRATHSNINWLTEGTLTLTLPLQPEADISWNQPVHIQSKGVQVTVVVDNRQKQMLFHIIEMPGKEIRAECIFKKKYINPI